MLMWCSGPYTVLARSIVISGLDESVCCFQRRADLTVTVSLYNIRGVGLFISIVFMLLSYFIGVDLLYGSRIFHNTLLRNLLFELQSLFGGDLVLVFQGFAFSIWSLCVRLWHL